MQKDESLNSTIRNVKDGRNKYLTFSIGDEDYELAILKVRGIEGLLTITKIPRMPDYIKGIINLRGKVIPIIDLRLKFGVEEIPYNDRTCCIIVEITSKRGIIVMGIIVDKVLEVLNIGVDEIENNINFGTFVEDQYILGIAKAKEGTQIILDIDKVMTSEELSLIEKVEKDDKTKQRQ